MEDGYKKLIRDMVKHGVTAGIKVHEDQEAVWKEAHDKSHAEVMKQLTTIANNTKDIVVAWDGIGTVGRGIIMLGKVVFSIGTIIGGLWALMHFGGSNR